MCGIVGGVGENLPLDELSKSVVLLEHRGPDANGTWCCDSCFLGHTRLSILDLNERSNQPFSDDVDGSVLVYNGEIYNFKEIRILLCKDGVNFKTDSDTEIILHSWRKWGKECFNKFKGMFALAIWNSTRKELIIARDRFGEKPLYYYEFDGKLIFSSEIKAISKISKNRTIDLDSINDYLHWGYISSPHSILSGVKKLPPGHLAIFKNGSFSEMPYFTKTTLQTNNSNFDSTKLRELIIEAVGKNLRADVPVALSLSSGIDSALIAAIAKREYNVKLQCITVGYENNPSTDEREKAKYISNLYEHDYHEIEISENDLKADFTYFSECLDEPIADIAGYSYSRIFKKAQEIGLKVILSGIGSDELFCGYELHNFNAKKSQKREILRTLNPQFLRTQLSGNKEEWKNQLLWPNENVSASKPQNFLKKFNPTRLPKDILSKRENETWYSAIQRVLTSVWLEGNSLALNDRLAMNYSVECRTPYLYTDLSNYAQSIFFNQKDLSNPKGFLKQSIVNDLPHEILNRKKMGFTPPVGKWIEIISKNYSEKVQECEFLNKIIDFDSLKTTNSFMTYKLALLSLSLNKLLSY
jgi:asparagine synthase (glutamine-hydrolysing)